MSYGINLSIRRSLAAQVISSATATNGAAVDISQIEGPVWIHVNAPVASASDTITFTVEHSSASGSGFAAVDAAILVNPDTGAAATFTVVTDAIATDETLALIRDQLKRYVRVVATTAGSGVTAYVYAEVVGQLKYT